MKATELCGCGERLHYVDREAETTVRALIRSYGPLITVEVGRHAWRVPRHYIALHGLAAPELPELAERYGWERIR